MVRAAEDRHDGLYFIGNHLEGIGVKDCARRGSTSPRASSMPSRVRHGTLPHNREVPMNGLFRSTLALGLTGCAAQPGWVDDRFFIRVDDADLYVHAVGEGTSNKFVLLLHDEPAQGAGGYELSPAAPTLHEEMVMIYLDQRGAGASQTRTAPSDITLDLLTDYIVAVIDGLEPMYLEPRTGHPELWLMGHGWGGMLGPSVLLETDASDRLAGWIEVAGAHDFPKVHQDSAIQLLDAADSELAEDLDEEARADWTAIQQTARNANQTPKTSTSSWPTTSSPRRFG